MYVGQAPVCFLLLMLVLVVDTDLAFTLNSEHIVARRDQSAEARHH